MTARSFLITVGQTEQEGKRGEEQGADKSRTAKSTCLIASAFPAKTLRINPSTWLRSKPSPTRNTTQLHHLILSMTAYPMAFHVVHFAAAVVTRCILSRTPRR